MSRCSCLVVGPQGSWSLVASLAEVSARLHSCILLPRPAADDDAGTDYQDQHNQRRFIFIGHPPPPATPLGRNGNAGECISGNKAGARS